MSNALKDAIEALSDKQKSELIKLFPDIMKETANKKEPKKTRKLKKSKSIGKGDCPSCGKHFKEIFEDGRVSIRYTYTSKEHLAANKSLRFCWFFVDEYEHEVCPECFRKGIRKKECEHNFEDVKKRCGGGTIKQKCTRCGCSRTVDRKPLCMGEC